jgi:hypothetical protein
MNSHGATSQKTAFFNLRIVSKTILMSIVLYWNETWSLILIEKCGPRVLSRIFGPKSDERCQNSEENCIRGAS